MEDPQEVAWQGAGARHPGPPDGARRRLPKAARRDALPPAPAAPGGFAAAAGRPAPGAAGGAHGCGEPPVPARGERQGPPVRTIAPGGLRRPLPGPASALPSPAWGSPRPQYATVCSDYLGVRTSGRTKY